MLLDEGRNNQSAEIRNFSPEVLAEWNGEGESFTGTQPEDGQAHFDVLLAEGLDQFSTVLEIGCGMLHAGIPLIEFLEPNGYCGIDPNEWLRETTLRHFGYQDLFAARGPRFSSRYDFDGSEFGVQFDYVFSHSVLSHASVSQFGEYLRNTKKVLAPGGKIVTSFFLAERGSGPVLGERRTPDGLDSGETEWVYPGRSYFTWTTVQREAQEAGLSVTLKPEYTQLVQNASLKTHPAPGHCHDWLVLTPL